ncbi:MAG: insulinase family protein [Labilithrix sp.]|nr:insulinase family protein [Labilithrix sp.]MCW5812980.1 insulinase family protein [Labilithrix sp.]
MRRLVAVSALLLLAACGGSPPPAAPVASPPGAKAAQAAEQSDPPLAMDARVTKGKLENGLTYYILPHKKPEARAQVWLAVNAGSVLEDDDQRGLAHFVEHMAFNGTKRFPKSEIVDFLEKSGVRFGADLNAYTSFDETVYTLQVPTDKPEILAKAFNVLRDWAGDVTFDPVEVDKERGVVLEEWRLGRGAGMRLFDKRAPVLFHGSKYAERITIGKPEILKTASRDTLYRYYKDWYRPDNMAVIAVGDFTAADIEKQIKAEFSNLPPAAKNAKPRALAEVPAHAQDLYSIETDPEMTATSISVMTKLPKRPHKSAKDYRRVLTEQLYNSMLNARFDEIRRAPNAPFLSAMSYAGGGVRSLDVFSQNATVKEDGIPAGYAALREELLRVEKHGFVKSELERAKASTLRNFQQHVKEYDKRDSRVFSAEIVRNFLTEEAMPGPEKELALAEEMLPTITLEELNVLGKTLGKGSHVLAVAGGPKMVKPTPETFSALDKELAAKDVKPYDDGGEGVPLMAKAPAPGKVTATKSIAEIGVTEWTLSNGVRVVVKPTTFANDEVKLSAFSPGGTSLVKDADFDTARAADTIVSQGGIGPVDAVQLRKSLAGKIASLNPRINELEEGLTGNASPNDLETLMQMVHLTFTAPRKDESAFASWRARETERVKNRRLSPESTFLEDMSLFSTQNHLRRQPTTPESLLKVDLDKALAIYKDRFGDAGDFTFLFVGNVELEKLKPLVETYLGSLPSSGRKETWKDPKVARPSGVAKKVITKGSEPKSRVMLTFHGNEKFTRDTENDMKMLGEALRIRLREVLREDMGGVYGVGANGGIARRPRAEYSFNVSFGCSPENVDKLEKAVFDEIQSVQAQGVSDLYVTKIKEMRKRAHETDLKENSFWLRELERAYVYGDDPKQIQDISAMTEKVTSDRIKAAAKKYLSKTQYILGELKPETTAAAK